MKTVLGWKLYYGDGSVVSSREQSWTEARSDNVQVLIVYFADIYRIWHDDHEDEENFRDMYFGKDYYWQLGNGQAQDVPDGVRVKLGRELPQEEWRAVYNQALQDVKF